MATSFDKTGILDAVYGVLQQVPFWGFLILPLVLFAVGFATVITVHTILIHSNNPLTFAS
jgi:hypothetical protein